MRRKVSIIDYGMGNVWSVMSAINFLGSNCELISDPIQVNGADFLILPGVGSFRRGMENLCEKNLDEAIIEAVNKKGVRLLGICLGMQLLGSHSSEDGNTNGLGFIDCSVDMFSPIELIGNKLPHIGFNAVNFNNPDGLFKNIKQSSYFYFVHSYRMLVNGFGGSYSLCNYGTEFLASFEKDNIYGTQFHPEKSQTNGLLVLKNFLELN